MLQVPRPGGVAQSRLFSPRSGRHRPDVKLSKTQAEGSSTDIAPCCLEPGMSFDQHRAAKGVPINRGLDVLLSPAGVTAVVLPLGGATSFQGLEGEVNLQQGGGLVLVTSCSGGGVISSAAREFPPPC